MDRGISLYHVNRVIERYTQGPERVFGQSRVNVSRINLPLDGKEWND